VSRVIDVSIRRALLFDPKEVLIVNYYDVTRKGLYSLFESAGSQQRFEL